MNLELNKNCDSLFYYFILLREFEECMEMKIKRVRDNKDLPLPEYKSDWASGMDLRADIKEDIKLASLDRMIIPTGIAIELEKGMEAQVRARSGLAIKKGITLVNSPGTIDADYRGEIGVIMINLGKEDVVIKRGERIAQLVVCPIIHPKIAEVNDLNDTSRGDGGFGSTGV